jgi:phage terminase large subunit-like protein
MKVELVPDTRPSPADLVHALVLESGELWGDVAADFQLEDVEAIFDDHGPLWHFLTRPRGGSKSLDLAAVLLAWLICEAAPGARGYIVASDRDQGAFAVLDAIGGLVRRTPELQGRVDVQTDKVVAGNGATVEVLSADGASSWGLRPDFAVLDEAGQWPSTRNARAVWTALISATGKMPGCRLVVLTSAGEPSHWSHKVLKTARKSKSWHVHEIPGPLPWADLQNLAEQRLLLTDSQYARLHLNQWTEAEDRLVSAADLEAATAGRDELELPPVPGTRYVTTLDVGMVRDRTVVVVAHSSDSGVVVDAVWWRQGTRRNPVDLQEVEDAIVDLNRRYPGEIFIDEAKAEFMLQRLRGRSLPIEVFNFTTTSVGILASTLVRAFRTRTLSLPDHDVMLDELSTVRIIENSAGVARLGHDSDKHDDFAVAVGLAVYRLTDGWRNWMRAGLDLDDLEPDVDAMGKPFLPVIAGLGIVGAAAMPASIDRGDEPDEPIVGGKTAVSPFT